MITFDTFVKLNWPANVPRECTRLDQDGNRDCLERGDRDACESCKTFADLSAAYEEVNSGNQLPADDSSRISLWEAIGLLLWMVIVAGLVIALVQLTK